MARIQPYPARKKREALSVGVEVHRVVSKQIRIGKEDRRVEANKGE
jgi:hypothetical protein